METTTFSASRNRLYVGTRLGTGFWKEEAFEIKHITEDDVSSIQGIGNSGTTLEYNPDSRRMLHVHQQSTSPFAKYLKAQKEIFNKTFALIPVRITNDSGIKFVGGASQAVIINNPPLNFSKVEKVTFKILLLDWTDNSAVAQ